MRLARSGSGFILGIVQKLFIKHFSFHFINRRYCRLPFRLNANRCVFGLLFSISSRNTTQDDLQVKWSVTASETPLPDEGELTSEISLEIVAAKLSFLFSDKRNFNNQFEFLKFNFTL